MVGDEDPPLGHDHPVLGPLVRASYAVAVKPAIWIRKNIVEPNLPSEPEAWYHRRFRRVPTIDECYVDDVVCRTEAQAQFMRDKQVESSIVRILKNRLEDCVFYEKGTGPASWGQPRFGPTIDLGDESNHPCKQLLDTWRRASENYFIKYGELGYMPRVENAFMKQKHRLMWERRHGPIGSGMKEEEQQE
eukprot:TRINITY_DN20476_c0_g1_i1.p1 TRINITY_DN20476_c0_g1~~TRINITY_DN20476_c0_g1_i1.p1  ORF type:complete len:190 (-),score=33.72 TRINITY_DN20476_c0_g1_i1:87-656(-)